LKIDKEYCITAVCINVTAVLNSATLSRMLLTIPLFHDFEFVVS